MHICIHTNEKSEQNQATHNNKTNEEQGCSIAIRMWVMTGGIIGAIECITGPALCDWVGTRDLITTKHVDIPVLHSVCVLCLCMQCVSSHTVTNIYIAIHTCTHKKTYEACTHIYNI
jgi:hypothetical protein